MPLTRAADLRKEAAQFSTEDVKTVLFNAYMKDDELVDARPTPDGELEILDTSNGIVI